MTNEDRTKEQLAKRAQRMKRCCGCTIGEIAGALELTIAETKRLLKIGG